MEMGGGGGEGDGAEGVAGMKIVELCLKSAISVYA